MQYLPRKAMGELRRRNLALGTRIFDRVNVVDLLTTDSAYPTTGEVCGAVGFHARDGRCLVFRAKRTILACGAMAKKGKWHIDNVVGDGVALAYRAGSRLVDLEMGYGGTFTVLMKHYDLGGYNVAVGHGAWLINALGERFMEKYDPVRFERSELARVVAGFVKEIVDGRGPVYIDLRQCDPSYWEDLKTLAQGEQLVILSDLVPDPHEHPLLIEPTWGQWSNGIGGVQIDLRCRASLPGLFAAGATAKNRAVGTHASAGIPTAFAMNSGYFAGETAALEARQVAMPNLPADAIARLAEEMFAPLHRPAVGLNPHQLHDKLSQLENSVVDGIVTNLHKFERKLEFLETMDEALGESHAEDLHELVKYFEARNVIDSARIQCRLAIDRTESRESFYREDYPETDDSEWFCWHGATRTQHGDVFDREPIPIERYQLQPPAARPKQLSPIAAMMRGCYDPAVYA
jgi:succinate dehydrogenase/fumarate reductase flavoprotein subunit